MEPLLQVVPSGFLEEMGLMALVQIILQGEEEELEQDHQEMANLEQ